MNPRLRRHLFAVLYAARGFALKLSDIMETSGDWTRSEVSAELRRLEDAGFVATGRNALDEITYVLTPEGQGNAAGLKL